jgi:addiction module HigA family antidote
MPRIIAKTPITALKIIMAHYGTNPTRIAREVKVSQTSIRNLLLGDNKMTAGMALRLAKHFGTSPEYWLTLQINADLAAAAKDKELSSILKGITRAKKPAPAKAAPKKALAPKAKPARASKPDRPSASKKPVKRVTL